MHETAQPRRRLRLAVVAFLAVLALLVAVFVVIHTPPFKAFALRQAIGAALTAGIRLEAERLDYSLVSLRVGLAGVRVFAVGESEPFLVASRVEAQVSPGIFRRHVFFDDVTIAEGSIRIRRRADGTSNLPGTGGGSQDPPAIPIGRLTAPRLAVDFRDEQHDVAVQVPALSLELSRDGRIAIAEPMTVTIGSSLIRFNSIAGGVSFDGRDMTLSNVRVEMPEARLRLDGPLRLVRQQPSADLRVSGDIEVERAAVWWGQVRDAPRGSVHVDGTMRGPLSSPLVDLQTGSTRVTWNGTNVDDLAARVRVDVDGLHVDDGSLDFAGGRLSGSVAVVWETSRVQVDATWNEIEAAGIAAIFGVTTPAPVGRASGSLTAAGRVGNVEDWRGTGRLTLAAARGGPNRIAAPGDARLDLANGRWTLDARHLLGGAIPVRASLTGGLRGSEIGESTISGEVRAAESDLRVITRLLSDFGVSLSGAGDAASGSVRADALIEGTIGRPVVRARVESDALTVAGQDVVDVKARGTLEGSTFTLDELTAQQPLESGQNRPRGGVLVSGTYDFTSQKYTARVQGGAWAIEPLPDVPLSAVIGLDYSGEGRGRLAFGKGRVTSSRTTWDGVDLGEIAADVELKGDIAVVAARAAEFDAVVDATVTLRAPYAATVDARAPALDLARLANKAQLSATVEGTADVLIRATGDIERWRDGSARAEVLVRGATLDRVPVAMPQPAAIRYEARRLTIDRLEASLGQTSLAVSGTLPVSNPVGTGAAQDIDTILALLTGDVNDVAFVVNTIGVARRLRDPVFPGGQGPMTLLARVGGSLESPSIAADLEVGPAVVMPRDGFPPIEALRLRAHLENDLVELREADLMYRGAHVVATGQAPLGLFTGAASRTSPGEIRVRATATGVTSAVMVPFVDEEMLAQVGGSLDGSLDLASSSLEVGDITGELRLDRVELSVANVPLRQRVPTRVVARDGIARIEAWEWEGEGTSLKLTGQVHLSDRQAGILADGTVDARLLTPFLGDSGIATAGRLDSRLSITGPISEPTVNGDLRLMDGELRIREPRIIADEVNARAVLARGQVYLSDLRGVVNGGTLTGTANLQYAPELRGRFAATVSGMALDFPAGLRSEIDATLELTSNAEGTEASGSRVSGLVSVKRGSYREPLALVTGLLANLRRTAATGSPRAAWLDQVGLDVRVVTEEDLIIDNNVARAQLGADLRVINVASAPALSGRAELREGGQLFLGRNTYTVQSGTIDFSNPTVIEPILGIDATTRVSGVDVQIRMTGTPDSLMTDLSSPSDPELGRADLASLLLTGRTLNDLGDEQAAVVGAQVLGNLAGDVLGFAGRAVGLDTLRVGGVETTTTRDPADLASEVDPTSRLTFGKSLGSQLDVTLSQSLREGGAQTWIVDYKPVRRVALRFVSNDEELRSYEFRHDLTFGGPPPIRSADVSRTIERPRVSAVTVTGSMGLPEARIRERLRLREGERFDFLEWQRDRDRLEELYHRERRLSARVGARRRETAEGVELTYDLDAGPETVVRLTGAAMPRGVIADIESAWARSIVGAFVIEEAQDIVRRQMVRTGFHQSMVSARLVDDAGTRTLAIDVMPGPHTDRVEVRLDGASETVKADLLDVIDGTDRAAEALANPSALQQALVSALRSNGYLQGSVQVELPVVDGAFIVLPVTVKEGRQYRIGTIGIEGVSGEALEKLRAEVVLNEGAVYSDTVVDAARVRLLERRRQDGYANATIDARPLVNQAEAIVDVVFDVQEGPRQVIGDITVTSNGSVGEDVVRRAMRLNVGDTLRPNDWLESRRRLFETGLFRRVDIATEPIDGDGSTAPVRLAVTVEEWPALRLRYGFQVTEERPEEEVNGRDLVPGVSADVTRRTVFGRAITVGAAAQYQRRDRLGRLFLSAPTMLGRPIQSSIVLERGREEQRAFTLVSDRTTASWEQRLKQGSLSVSYGLRFERNHTFDTAVPNPDFPALDVNVHIGRFITSATWDTRDDPADSVTGIFASSSLEHAAAALGSDFFFIRSLSQIYRFQSWRGVVLASAARLGMARPLKGQELLPSQRFFAGGARTVRGVAEDSLGGLDIFGLPAGGQAMVVLTQEIRFPIYKWLRGVTFIDAGNVFARTREIELGSLVGSGGVGLRLATPFVLLRVDYGKTLWNGAPADNGRWVFGIGQTF